MIQGEMVESYSSRFLVEIIMDSPFVLIDHEQCLKFWRGLSDEYRTRTFPRFRRTLVRFIDEVDTLEREIREDQEEMERRYRALHKQALR